MQRLEVSGAVRPLRGSLGVKGLIQLTTPKGVVRSQKANIIKTPKVGR